MPYWTCEAKQIPSSTPLLGLGHGARAACRMVDRHGFLPRPFSRHPRASEHLARASPPPDEAAKGSTTRHLLSPRPCLQQQDDGGT
eukprot:scaffold2278_cov30-Phaeocystis_antarctica.AAC.1